MSGELQEVGGAFASLSDKQQKFVDSYLECLNATKAYGMAGYEPHTSHACRMVANGSIKAAIKERRDELLSRLDATAEHALRGYAKIANFDYRILFDGNGDLLPPDQMPDEAIGVIEGIDVQVTHVGRGKGEPPDTVITKKLKIASAKAAWDKLGEYHKLFEGDKHMTVNINHADKVDFDLSEFQQQMGETTETITEKLDEAIEHGVVE